MRPARPPTAPPYSTTPSGRNGLASAGPARSGGGRGWVWGWGGLLARCLPACRSPPALPSSPPCQFQLQRCFPQVSVAGLFDQGRLRPGPGRGSEVPARPLPQVLGWRRPCARWEIHRGAAVQLDQCRVSFALVMIRMMDFSCVLRLRVSAQFPRPSSRLRRAGRGQRLHATVQPGCRGLCVRYSISVLSDVTLFICEGTD